MQNPELEGRLLALRHMLVVLMSKLSDEDSLEALVQGADNAELEEKFARRAGAYRQEVDAIAVRARQLRRVSA
jgi:hypothetical protein